jgi:hypothetical protein
MGAHFSRGYSSNDYELVIKTSKELEYLLEAEWGAQGKGLHEKLNFVQVCGQGTSGRGCACQFGMQLDPSVIGAFHLAN